MGASQSTLVSWVVLAAVGAWLYRHYTSDNRRRTNPARTVGNRQHTEQRNQPPARREPRRQRIGETLEDSSTTKPKPQPPRNQPSQTVESKNIFSSDDDVDNREFARQLSSAKQGTKFGAKSKEEVRQKSVKLSHAEEPSFRTGVQETKTSAPSSTAGIDADDDQSSAAASPVVGTFSGAGDVSDMLEKSAPGPSVLRLTGTDEKKKPKANNSKSQTEPAETKKQRQRRNKAEVAKANNAQAEVERKAKQEAQRRLARVSEGRAAKDGSGFMAAKAANNVWTGNNGHGPNGGSSGANGFLPVQPLDTFEPSVKTSSSSAATKPSASSVPSISNQSDSWMSSIPSEEEQMEMLREEEWSQVKTKPRKSKKKDNADTSNDEATPAPQRQENKFETAGVKAQEAKRPVKAFTSKSSFAALKVDGTADLEEEEWDV